MESKKYIALTFDDGPNDTTTGEVLIKLLKHNIVASFFLVGDLITMDSIQMVKDAYAMGCELGNHSKTHVDLTTLSKEEIIEEVTYTSERIMGITRKAPAFFRPPYLNINENVKEAVRLPMISGDTCEDWLDEVTAKERAKRIQDQIKPGEIILMHDAAGNRKTVEALDLIIPELKRQGYCFVTISQLFAIYNKKVDEGILYRNATGN